MKRFYDDDGFEFDRLNLLGAAYRGLTDVGEVLMTLDRIPNADMEAWVREFAALGDRVQGLAESCMAAHHPTSARTALLRACSYFATASSNAPGTSDRDRFQRLWERHRDCWDRATKLFEPPVESVRIPFEGTELQGYFFHARSPHGHGPATGPRPKVILNNGSDGPVSDMWLFGGAAAVERGWNAVTLRWPGTGCRPSSPTPVFPARLGEGRHAGRGLGTRAARGGSGAHRVARHQPGGVLGAT
ncbi:MAG: hypothetical protein MUP97_03935, partial [Acidimicrobiia bacterium]|nr:hypothetical protein [Acidimicrobiia bacterium]